MSKPVENPQLEVEPLGHGRYVVRNGSTSRIAFAAASARDTWVFLDGRVYVIGANAASSARAGTRATAAEETDALAAPMPATVVKIEVAPGQTVTRDTLLVMLEAMKMELPIKAPRDGRVTAIHCRPGEIVQPGAPLLDLE